VIKSRFLRTAGLGLCVSLAPASAVYADIIYSDLGSGQNGAYSVGGGAWFAVPWIGSQGPGGGDFAIPMLGSSVFLDEIDVLTARLGDNVMTVDIVNGGYAFVGGAIIGSVSVMVNNGLTSAIFATPIELDPGNDYWIYFTAPNLADADYQLVASNTISRFYQGESNYYSPNNLPGFAAQGTASPEPTTIGLIALCGVAMVLARYLAIIGGYSKRR